VGDSYFQHKSFDRIRQFRDEGISIMLVTHGMGDVRMLCDRVLLLDKGRVIKDGLPDEVVDYYNALVAEKENAGLDVEQRREQSGWLLTRSGTGEARVGMLCLLDAVSRSELTVARVGQKVELRIEISIHADIPKLVIGLMIRDKQGHIVWGTNTWHTRQVLQELEKNQHVNIAMPFTCDLGPGSYAVTVALTSSDSHITDNFEWSDNVLVFDVFNGDKPIFVGSTWLDARLILEQRP
jgi:lipopolysaccharide transport system ATP-binding protein